MWALKATDAGVEEGAPPSVLAARALIAQAVQAANDGTEFTGFDRDHGIAAMLVRISSEPFAVRFGRLLPPPHPGLVGLMRDMGADDFVASEVDWLYDIPLHQV